MPCDQPFDRVSAYIDDELPAEERRAFALHLETCPACASLATELRQIGRSLAASGREPMPPELPSRVRLALAQAAERPEEPAAPATRLRRWPVPVMLRQAAAILVACLVSSLATWWFVTGASQERLLEQDLLSAHVRSLLQDSPIQVASSDAHTVKPWFAGKVDFSPEVRDLAAQGFPLVGGRLDSIGGKRVGALVYKRRLHLINVFAWATQAPDAAPSLSVRSGYNVLTWTRGGVAYAAVSDLDGKELARLAELL